MHATRGRDEEVRGPSKEDAKAALNGQGLVSQSRPRSSCVKSAASAAALPLFAIRIRARAAVATIRFGCELAGDLVLDERPSDAERQLGEQHANGSPVIVMMLVTEHG